MTPTLSRSVVQFLRREGTRFRDRGGTVIFHDYLEVGDRTVDLRVEVTDPSWRAASATGEGLEIFISDIARFPEGAAARNRVDRLVVKLNARADGVGKFVVTGYQTVRFKLENVLPEDGGDGPEQFEVVLNQLREAVRGFYGLAEESMGAIGDDGTPTPVIGLFPPTLTPVLYRSAVPFLRRKGIDFHDLGGAVSFDVQIQISDKQFALMTLAIDLSERMKTGEGFRVLIPDIVAFPAGAAARDRVASTLNRLNHSRDTVGKFTADEEGSVMFSLETVFPEDGGDGPEQFEIAMDRSREAVRGFYDLIAEANGWDIGDILGDGGDRDIGDILGDGDWDIRDILGDDA